jgi:acyl-CoA thioesterase-2
VSDVASPRESLAEILRLERRGEDEFAASFEDFWGESQPGDVLARAALAAAESCAELPLASLHASFLRLVPPGRTLRLRVERLADAAEGARREVRVEADAVLCRVLAGFAPAGEGPSYQDLAPGAAVPPPERLPTTLEQARAEGWTEYARGPFEFRRASPLWPDAARGESHAHLEWMRPRVALPAAPRLRMAALVFLSAFYPHWAFERRIGRRFAYARFRLLDHALWLHDVALGEDWLLMEASSELGRAGRALAQRRLFTRDGRLVASATQSALVAEAPGG